MRATRSSAQDCKYEFLYLGACRKDPETVSAQGLQVQRTCPRKLDLSCRNLSVLTKNLWRLRCWARSFRCRSEIRCCGVFSSSVRRTYLTAVSAGIRTVNIAG